MEVADGVGPRQVEEVVVAAEVTWPIGEASAAELRLAQAERLDHGAHGAVKDEDAIAGESFNDLAYF